MKNILLITITLSSMLIAEEVNNISGHSHMLNAEW